MKFHKEEDKLIIEDDFYQKVYEPFSNKVKEKKNKFAGMVTRDEFGNKVMGLCIVIDRSWKGKTDDYTDIIYRFEGSKEDFLEMCEKNKINVIYN